MKQTTPTIPNLFDPEPAPDRETQSEFMSDRERRQRINQRMSNAHGNPPSTPSKLRCATLYFSVEQARISEARHLIAAVCRDKLIFMRIRPQRHTTLMQIELFLSASVTQRVKEILRASFQCRTSSFLATSD